MQYRHSRNDSRLIESLARQCIRVSTNMARGMGEAGLILCQVLLSEPTHPINGIYAPVWFMAICRPDLPPITITVSGDFRSRDGIPGGPNNRPHNPLTFADIDSTQADTNDGHSPQVCLQHGRNSRGWAKLDTLVGSPRQIYNQLGWELKPAYAAICD